MNYCVTLRIKTDGDEWLTVGGLHCIPWKLRDLINASSGWTIINDNTAGSADMFSVDLQKGVLELTNHPEKYIGYEATYGMGTVREVLEFYQELLKDCKEHPYTEVFGHIVP